MELFNCQTTEKNREKGKRKKGAVIKLEFDASFGSIGLKGGNLSPSVLTESKQGDA